MFSCLPSVVVVLLDRCARRGQVTFGSVGLGSLRVDVRVIMRRIRMRGVEVEDTTSD